MATQAAGSGPSTLEFALVRHLPCPTDALSSYSLGEGRCWERLGRNTHLLPGWSKPRDMNEVGNRVHGMERGRCIYYLMTDWAQFSFCCLDCPAQGLVQRRTLEVC